MNINLMLTILGVFFISMFIVLLLEIITDKSSRTPLVIAQIIAMAFIIVVSVVVAFIEGPVVEVNAYPQTFQIVELDYENYVVYCNDANGSVFSFYGCEDYYIGDLVSCTMDSKNTSVILDDEIIECRYSGFNINSRFQ